jgi:DNA polymerase III subunit epsilon
VRSEFVLTISTGISSRRPYDCLVVATSRQNASFDCGSTTLDSAQGSVRTDQLQHEVAPAITSSTPGPLRFAALDFETADCGRDSACALSIVIVENDAVQDTWTTLIRPPRRDFVFTNLHGISWGHVRNKPSFGELWADISKKLEGLSFVAAHNAAFDRSVFQACCHAAAVPPLKSPFVCTVRAARSIWGFRPANLAHVCHQLRIPLQHHDAESDARACARILLAARARGLEYGHILKTCALKSNSAMRKGQQ